MRIFLSYDDIRRDVAERLALGLRGAGHDVFFDQDSLPAGTSYDDRIRNAILRSHLFVFLVSGESVKKGAYALTELAIAEHRWPHPTGRVLPVLLDDTPIASLPPYLRAVSVLDPQGDTVGDTLNAVARLSRERRRRLTRRATIPVAGVLLLGASVWFAARLRGDGMAGQEGSGPEPIEAAVADSAVGSTDDPQNSRIWKLKNERHVRLAGDIVANESNISDNIVRDAVEWNAWRYNRCYDAAFGHLASGLPEGMVVIRFEIRDQLPRDARVERSDFQAPDFDECIAGTLLGQTVNAAGAAGAGSVLYSFRFLPN